VGRKLYGNVHLMKEKEKNLDYGIDTLKLEIPNFTRSINRYTMKFVNKLVVEKKEQYKVAKQCKSNPQNFGNMLIVSLNHKLDLVT